MPIGIVGAIVAATAVVGVGISAYSMVQQQKASQQQAQVQNQILDQQRKAEELRKKQMELDAARKRREIVRNQIRARSQALATAQAQGAAGVGTSVLPGAYGSIQSQSAGDLLAVNQNQEIGEGLFDINENISGLYRQSASLQSSESTYRGLFSLGGAMISSAQTIGQVGGYFVPNASQKVNFYAPDDL